MNNKVNYTAIGFSVLVSLLLMFSFSYWLLKPTVDKNIQKYIIYFDESILGLNIDAPVKYRGISVGRVSSFKVNPKNSEQVEVLISILKDTPIKVDTVAKLTAQGITGLSYINLSMGKHNSEIISIQDNNEYPIIQSAPSFLEDIEQSIGTVSSKISTTLTKTEELLNDENQKQITLLLTRSANFMDKLEKTLDQENQEQITVLLAKSVNIATKIDILLDKKTIKTLQQSSSNIESLTSNIDKMVPNIDNLILKTEDWEKNIHHSFDSIMVSYLGITESMDEIKRAISNGEFNIKDITSDLVPTINNTLLDMQELMIRFSGSLEQYDRSPGDILFKQEEINKGPGEE